MAQDYREIYGALLASVDSGLLGHGNPRNADDLLRVAGIDVLGTDSIKVSQSALLIYFAQKINDLEKQIADLEKSQETKR